MTASRILDGAYHDPRCAWQRYRQSASDGAIVVRPDRFIAWRYPVAASDPRAVLTAVLSQILGRGPSARAGSAGFLAGRVPRSADDSLSPAGPRC
jgi:2,4-dichlorophenol 6-monooxygenase